MLIGAACNLNGMSGSRPQADAAEKRATFLETKLASISKTVEMLARIV